jgi:hypothetical protein
MKIINSGIPAVLLAAYASSASADVTTSGSMPSGPGVIAQSTAFGATLSRIFDIDANANHSRGNRFVIPDGGGTTFRIDSITIQASGGPQVFENDTFTLHIYKGSAADWNTGTGRIATNPDFYSGTTVTPLTSEAFVVSESIAANNYITFALTTPLVVDESETYGFFVTYEQGDGLLTSLAIQESGSPLNPDDGRTSITATSHTTSPSRQLDYWVQGEAIDPGITDSTLVPSDSLISVGDTIDLDITFDTTVDTAVLTTPGGVVDLLALDAGDATPGDGTVVVIETPAFSFTYQVDVTKTGQTSENVSAEVVVVDPSLVADNALSTAIKADAPLFYYRFEEPVNTGHIIDYSGNGRHTDEIVGPLIQGGSSGGVGNAIRLNGNGGIRVPATRNMSLAYTFTAVVDLDEFPSSSLGNILSMSDGGSSVVGRSLLHTRPSGLGTEMSGGIINVADTSVLSSGRNAIIHMVSNPAGVSGREVSIYVNGILYSTTPVGNVAGNNGNWLLGGNKTLAGDFLSGWIDEAAVFGTVLTEGQIAAQADAFFNSAEDAYFGFYADSLEVVTGESGVLTFMISDQATAATLNGTAVDISAGAGAYPITINPTENTTYTLIVEGPGGPFTSMIDVTIVAPPTPPRITSIVSNGSTPPTITLTIEGIPNTTYVVKASADLSDGFPTPLGTIVTDGAGVGTTIFEGFGASEFYRVETQ